MLERWKLSDKQEAAENEIQKAITEERIEGAAKILKDAKKKTKTDGLNLPDLEKSS
jgi:flagellar biosynthesis/type III secretory pathway protein FliH